MRWWKPVALYGGLVRFSHTIFALPFALGSFWVASDGSPRGLQMAALLLCMISARNSAMAFNRLVDARFDAENPRTRQRHLPAGLLTRGQVIGFIIANGILFVAGAWTFNFWTRVLAVPVWLLLLSYSLWKRWSWFCHWILGLAIGLSPVGAWIAVRGEITLFPIILGAFLMFWITGFDLIYSTQDEEVDRALGLHSVPARFGRSVALRTAAANHGIMWGIGGGLVWISDRHWAMTGTWLVTAGILIYIHAFRRCDDLEQLNRDFFIANGAISVLWLMGLLLWIYGGGGVV